jgi:ankyrin repeat protein
MPGEVMVVFSWEKEKRMNRICIVILMSVMICGSGCVPSQQQEARAKPEARMPAPVNDFDATEKLLGVWDLDDIQGSRVDYMRMLISEGADVNARNNTDRRTPLMLAAANSSSPEIVTLLIEKGAEVNTSTSSGFTPLMIAASNTPELVSLLLANGAKIEARTTRNETSLMFAVWNSPAEIGTLLIEAGADVNAKDVDGLTPLMKTARFSSIPAITSLLIEKGADVNANDMYCRTPLMFAAAYSSTPEIVSLLIEKGADVNATDNFGKTPLSLTTHPEILQLLKDAGARE